MKQRSGKLITKIVSMILCMCMLTTTLASCAFWDAIVDVFTPDDQENENNGENNNYGGDNTGGNNTGGSF